MGLIDMATKTNRKRKSHVFQKLVIFAILIFAAVMLAKKIPFTEAKLTALFDGSSAESEAGTDNENGGETDIPGQIMGTSDAEMMDALSTLAEEDSRVKKLIKNINDYPEDLIKLLLKNPEARDFVLDYPEHKGNTDMGEIESSELSDGIPHFMQWDERWGYFNYGSCVLGVTGCGPTCLSMVIVGLTGNSDASPAAVAKFSEQNGYYVEGDGTTWDLMTAGSASFNLSSVEVPLAEDSMTAELNAGHPLIVSLGPGDFTDYGHFIVITGYENGMFTINDPNSIKLSSEGWYYSTLAPQIRNIWAFSTL